MRKWTMVKWVKLLPFAVALGLPSLIIVCLQTSSLLEATSPQLRARNTALQDDSGPWKQPAVMTRSLLEATSLQLGARNTALQDDSGPPWKQPAAMVNSFEDTALYASQKPLVHSQKKHKITSTIQKSRHVALDNECRSRNGSVAWRSLSEAARHTVAQRIVVNDEHELLYCAVPFLSTGPWMKVMYFISPNAKSLSDIGQVTGEELGKRNNFAYLSSFSLDEQERRLNTYLSFMVSRHPFQRLAIAYKLKLESDNAFFHDRYGKTIVKNYRKGSKNPSGDDVKFSEFAQYVSEVSVGDMNEHWQPLETLCQPCVVYYDVILHHESMEREAEELLDVAKLSSHVTKFPYDKWDSLEPSYVHKLYRELSPSLVGRLVQLYRSDFGVFSYSSLL